MYNNANKLKVYLAGGMVSGWQDDIISKLQGEFEFYNPSAHLLDSKEEYTAWDLHFVRNCDILFGFIEKSNPSGIGLSLEVGYAKALNKTIILVDEKSNSDEKFSNRFDIVRQSSSITYNKLEDGINMLQSFLRGIK